ncbi:hypothetical protein KEM52_002585, partial [Ascosphaera acerosa]
KEDEDRMGQESFEWIRMDADFEWICSMHLLMPGYMYLSQLQQDRDVVAQLESIHYLAAQAEDPLISSIFVRTIMDKRYFHGIRTAAAAALVAHAKQSVDSIGLYHLTKAFQELFCLPDSLMTRPNDFSDRAAYLLQCAIPEAMSRVRRDTGETPVSVKQFLLDKLKFNDNSDNEVLAPVYGQPGCVVSTTDNDNAEDDLNFDMQAELERQAEARLDQSIMDEIDRYRRMDEWTSSYQNIYSRTALQCLHEFMKAGIVTPDPMQILPYTRAGTFDLLRIEAFAMLADFNLFAAPEIMTWFMYVMSTDASPWLRRRLLDIFGRNLATVAFGTETAVKTPAAAETETGGLIIESEVDADASLEGRQNGLARRQTIPGALLALKSELGGPANAALRECLWAACNSPCITLAELRDLVVICSVLYDSVDHVLVELRYPRYWQCEHYGRGRLRFFKTNHYRTTATPKYVPRATLPPVPTYALANGNGAGGLKRRREGSHSSGHPQPHTPGATKVTLKLPRLSGTPSSSLRKSSVHAPPIPAAAAARPHGTPKLKLKLKSFGSFT